MLYEEKNYSNAIQNTNDISFNNRYLQTQSGGILSHTPFTQVRIVLPMRAKPLSQV